MNLPLPDDIIQNHILPYTYLIQSNELCKDIQTYHLTLNRIINLYKIEFKPNAESEPSLVNYLSRLRLDITRYYYKHILNKPRIYTLYLYMQLLENDRNRKKNINIIWGKLTPNQRLTPLGLAP